VVPDPSVNVPDGDTTVVPAARLMPFAMSMSPAAAAVAPVWRSRLPMTPSPPTSIRPAL